MLTPNDISNKRFEKSPFGGYKPEEVDSFLSEIAISYEKLYEAKEAAEEKMEVLAEKLEEYRANEDSLRTVLLGAQKLGDNIIRDSKAKAEVIISDAEGQVKQVFSESEGKINKERETLANLQKETAEFKRRLIRKVNRPPLRKSRAGYSCSVAVFRIIWIEIALFSNIAVKNLVYNLAYIFKYISSFYEFLVIACG